jgi:hypothetical protein
LLFPDPYSNKRPLTRCVVSSKNLDFISTCFKIGSRYFTIPQTSQGPIFTKIVPQKIESIPSQSSPEEVSSRSSTPFDIITLDELENSIFETPKENLEIIFENLRDKFGSELTPKQAQQLSKLVPKEKLVFEFDQKILTGGKVI